MGPDRPVVFLPNDHQVIWLDLPPEPPRRLLARIRAGEWQLPEAITSRFEIPPGLALSAHGSARAIVITPDRPLQEKAPGAPVQLSEDQVKVLRLMRAGLVGRQIAHALGRSPRWVRYQVAAIKRRCREEALARRPGGRPRKRGSPGRQAG
jgi:hypothetical protein